jgi:phage-related protein
MTTPFGGLIPSASSQKTVLYRLQEYQYGNGIKAFAPDGANGIIITWQINFDQLDATRVTTLETWLAANPTWITWVGDGTILPSNKTFRITKDGYQVTEMPGGVAAYQFNVEQVF